MEDCPVCLDPIDDDGHIKMKCKHYICLECYFGCEKNRINKCPLCRAIINENVVEEPERQYNRIDYFLRGYNTSRLYPSIRSEPSWNNPAFPILPLAPFESRSRFGGFNFSIPEPTRGAAPMDETWIQHRRNQLHRTSTIQDLILEKVFLNCPYDMTLGVAVYKFTNRVPDYDMTETQMLRNLEELFDNGYIRKKDNLYKRII